jgi:hypothetical protein
MECADWIIFESYGLRIDQLLGRLEQVHHQMADPACPQQRQRALMLQSHWLRGAIFAITTELESNEGKLDFGADQVSGAEGVSRN